MPKVRQDASITLPVSVSSEFKRIVRAHHANDFRRHIVSDISILIAVRVGAYLGRALFVQLVILILRDINKLPVLAVHDVEYATAVLLSNKKVFVALFAVTNRESI
jgi:hypothetical protein